MSRANDDIADSRLPHSQPVLSIPQLLKYDEALHGLQHDRGASAPEVVTHADGADAPRVSSSFQRYTSEDDG